jgi:hypothetical protein
MSIDLFDPFPPTSDPVAVEPSATAARPAARGAAPAALGLPLPLPLRRWGAAQAREALDEARLTLPVHLPEATVVSALTTVVLRSGEFAVKVYPPGTSPEHLDQLTDALRGSATAHLALGRSVVTSHGVVTLTPWLPAAAAVTWAETGALLRRFHSEHAGAEVPAWTPLSRLPSQLQGLPEEAAEVLLRARESLLDALGATRSFLGEGVIHGDVSPSNVMRTPQGPRLIDLDWVARAPREYDLAAASRRFRAGEISGTTYLAFCDAYGFDVLTWEGLPVLDRIADLGGVAFRLWDCRHHGRDLDWLEQELRVWRAPL